MTYQDPNNIILNHEELTLIQEEQSWWFQTISNIEHEKKLLIQAAKNTFKRDQITIRPYSRDMRYIKQKATQEWIPYQTYINSILHKFATGQLS